MKATTKQIDPNALVRIGEVLSYLQTDRYLDKAESANYLGVSTRTFESWMSRLPRYRPGGKPLFKKSELDAFMKQHEELPVPEIDVNQLADDAVKAVLGCVTK